MSVSDELGDPALLAKLLNVRCGSSDAAEDFLQRTIDALRQQVKDSMAQGGNDNGDGGTPAPTLVESNSRANLVVKPQKPPSALVVVKHPGDGTMVDAEHQHTLEQLDMIKAKVRS